MRRLLACLLALAVLSLPATVAAAPAVVQTTTCSGDDATCTFSGAPSASNYVIVVAFIFSATQAITIDGWAGTQNTLNGPVAVSTSRAYAFCLVGDGADTTFTVTTGAATQARTAAAEVSGLDQSGGCAAVERDYEDGTTTAATTHAITTDGGSALTVTAGDFIMGLVSSTSGANFATSAPGTSIPAADAEIGGDSQAQSFNASGTSADPTWTSVAGETTILMAVGIKAAAAAGTTPRGTLLGVLP